ncbi:glycosyltransferase family 4 protein [Halobacteria archaeon AArc-dxtr1]|nr:glycosyltransferase family 4 protein [Halobacteria archaeon AArc-dxtr1]
MGGAEVGMCRLLNGLEADKYNVTVIALNGHSEDLTDRIPSWVTVYDLQITDNPSISAIRKLWSTARSADVIVGSLYHSVMIARLSGLLNQKSTIATWQHIEEFKTDNRRKIIGLTNRLSDTVIADSEPVAEMYRSEFEVDEEFVKTVPIAGVRLDNYTPRQHQSRETVVVGSVGRLVPQKNYEALVKIAEELSTEDIVFRIAGDGPKRTEFETMIEDRNLENIEFVGEVTDVPEFLSEVDIYVQPSRWEGLCMTVIEAMAAGLPVVGSTVGGIERNVEEGASGFLYEPHDTTGFRSGIETLAADPDLRTQFGERGRSIVAESFTQEVLVAEFENAIQQA